jgi:hypothetical protein
MPHPLLKKVLDRRWNRSTKKLSRFRARPMVEVLEARLVMDTQPNGLPILHSLPGARTAIYIDFEGYPGYAPYSEDSDPTTFNPTEQAHITEAWRQMSSYFSIFDTDVTTIHPTVPFAWELISPSISGGYSYVGVFPNSQPESFVNQSNALNRVSGMAHEIGHNFGLWHQSDYDLNGNKVNEYSSGYDALHGPIMGVDYARNVHKWFLGHPSTSGGAGTLQNDVNIIANRIRAYEPPGGDGLLAHTNGGTIGTAVPLTSYGSVQAASGIIARLADHDAYSFTTNGGLVTIDAVAPAPSDLAIKLDIYRGDGTLLASRDVMPGATNNDQHVTLNLPADTYYAIVSSHGDYGDLGPYDLSVSELPVGWQTQDIGSVGKAGWAGYDFGAGAFGVAGAGADIFGTSDAFRYVYQTLSGDGSIVARVVSQDFTNVSAKAGVMIRDSLAANAKEVLMDITPGAGATFQYRSATGGSTTSSSAAGIAAPYYVSLVRTGNTLTGSYSPDGVTWTPLGSVSVTMGSTVYIGLADTSHTTSTLNYTTFDSVSFTGTIGLPPGWATKDVGSVGPTGNAGYDGSGTFLVGGAGADIGGTSDAFRYAYQTLTGDGSIVANVTSEDYTSDWAKAGVMIRDTLAPDAMQAMMMVTPANGAAFEYRSTAGDVSFTSNTPGPAAPYYVMISRTGTTLTGSYSADAITWTPQGSVDIPMGSTVYIGLAVTSGDATTVGNATFGSVYTAGLIGPVTGTYNNLSIPGVPTLSLGSGTGINVSWSDVAGNTGYAVERSADAATWTQIATTATGVTSYVDSSPAGSFRYFYRVSALSAGTRSAPSGVASLVNRPNAPSNVTVTSLTATTLVVNWRDVSGDTGYRIERSTDGTTFAPVGSVGTNVISFTNGGLTAGTTYYYRVIALSPGGDSLPSAVASNSTRASGAPEGDGGGGGTGGAAPDAPDADGCGCNGLPPEGTADVTFVPADATFVPVDGSTTGVLDTVTSAVVTGSSQRDGDASLTRADPPALASTWTAGPISLSAFEGFSSGLSTPETQIARAGVLPVPGSGQDLGRTSDDLILDSSSVGPSRTASNDLEPGDMTTDLEGGLPGSIL